MGGSGGEAGTGGAVAYSDEGSFDMPVDVTGMLPYAGEVSKDGESYYRITGVTPDAIYTITLALTDGLPYPNVPNAASFGSVACGWQNTVPGVSIDCAMRATGSGILDFHVSGDAEVGGAFVITFSEGGVVNEGHPGTPVVVSAFPFSGGALIQSHYLLTGLTPGAAYAVEFSDASGPVLLALFPDDTYQRQPELCQTLYDSGSPCQITADASGQIYLLTNAQEQTFQVTYTISVTAAALANEGSRNAPIDISAELPYDGMVHKESSWYIIDGLTPNAPYMLTLSDATDNVTLRVYGPGWTETFQRPDCQVVWANGGGSPITCVSVADVSGEIRIEVMGIDTADGATFNLDSTAGGLPNEGYYGNPIDITDARPWSGTIYNGPSYYRITGRAPATDHTVTISNLTANLDLLVYEEDTLQTLLCSSRELGSVDESCVVQTTTGELHIRVLASFSVFGATFTLDVTP
jgi:hypothetical protein